MSKLLDEGKYVARLGNQIVVYETESGALCAALPCQVCEGEKTGTNIKHTMTLVKRDGTVQTRTCDTLKEVFGWDGLDPFWLMDQTFDDKTFEIVVKDEQGNDGNVYAKVEWLNPLGGGPAMKMPAAADRRSVLAKYGAQFRALAGGAPVKPAAATPPPPPPGKVAPKPPPPPSTPPATMEGAWQALWDNHPGITEEQANNAWTSTLAKLFPNKQSSELSPTDWGVVKAKMADDVPY